jgi:hypothetical protein
VVMIEPVNEPERDKPSLLNVFYPQAQKAIRDTEKDLGVSSLSASMINSRNLCYT